MARPRNLPDRDALHALIDAKGRLSLRVTPNAGADAIMLPEGGAGAASGGGAKSGGVDGSGLQQGTEQRITVRVTATPENGKANAAVIVLLAKALGLPKSALTIVQGETGRNKVVEVER